MSAPVVLTDTDKTTEKETRTELRNPRVFVVLSRASLECHDAKGTVTLLNSEAHQGYLRRHGRDIGEARPDIVHQVWTPTITYLSTASLIACLQCLLALLDSPLNQSGNLQIYIHTAKDVLIQVDPRCRIPRTFRRFSGLMVQLLKKLVVRANDNPNLKLLRVIKGPVTNYLPDNTLKLGTYLALHIYIIRIVLSVRRSVVPCSADETKNIPH